MSKNRTIYPTNASKLMDRINKLNPSTKKLDKETRKKYNDVIEESYLLNKSIKEKKTDTKSIFDDIFGMINKIFKKTVISSESNKKIEH